MVPTSTNTTLIPTVRTTFMTSSSRTSRLQHMILSETVSSAHTRILNIADGAVLSVYREWVDLFADAGAQYFVQVSKHHDGYAIFDLPETVTKRTSVAQFPHMNLLQMLFDAADQYQPHLHKATYFSLPEWFSPAYAPFGFASWPGGNATNPYTNETLPYTGFVPVENYVTDVIAPEMQTLANMGTER
jgi:alpha-L-fucosidase